MINKSNQLKSRLLTIALFVVFLTSNFAPVAMAANPVVANQNADFDGFVIPERSAKLFPVLPRAYKVDVTAYTSSVEECDSDPFITADGSTTRDGIIATNFLPFGTKVRLPDLFGDKVFVVHDRMNARYVYRIDVWMEKKVDMRQFGIHRNVEIEIVEMGDGKTQWAARAAAMKRNAQQN